MKKITTLLLLSLLVTRGYSQYSFPSDKLMLDLKTLSSDSFEGRKTGTEGSKKARLYIIDQLKNAGLIPLVDNYEQFFSISKTVTGVNIIGFIPGKKEETLVISAHYDHLGIRNNIIYNGADDNASGIAALIAMIQYFKKNAPEHRLIFAFFDAEEIGLKGSAHFVKTLDLQKENIVLNINLDMVSRSDKNELYACGTNLYPHLKAGLEKMKTPAELKLLFGHDDPTKGKYDWTTQSDQYNFHQKKIPFIYFGVEDHADYHKSGDDFEKINPVFYKNSTETILTTLRTLDKTLE